MDFRNKLDELDNAVRNKNRFVVQGYTQIEGIDFKETFAPVARLEAIWMTLAFASYKDFKLFQMDVVLLKRRCMLNNPPGLLILHIRILCLN